MSYSWFQFITAIVASLAWPVCVVAVAWIIRREIDRQETKRTRSKP